MDINSLAELRSRGIYLFPGVQNTTQLTQETDQNFGLFKSLLREYARVLSNELFSDRDPSSKGATTLDQSYYSVLLSGRPPDPIKGTKEIPPIFELSFSVDRNLKSWAKCGAVPLTRCILQHRSVRHEKGERGDDGYFAKFEDDLQESIRAINAAGYTGSVFHIKIREKVASRRLSREATREERARELAKKMSLGHIFKKVGPQCLSVDEIFVSSELGENQKDFKKRLSEWTKLKAQKDLELKAKILLLQQETQPTKKFTSAELVTLLKWKTGKTTQGMKVDELRNSWEIAKLQDSPEDIMLPEQPQPPALPAVNQTALGRTIKRKFNEVITAVETTADAIDDDDFNTIAEQFNKNCERRGVRFASITNTTQV
jgi:hypothetical protein